MAFDFPKKGVNLGMKIDKKKKKKKDKSRKNIETKSGDMIQPDPDILSKRFEKKFKKYALSKESQLHAKDYDDGLDKAETRAMKEVMQEAALPMPKFSKGGRTGYKDGSKGCGKANKGRGRAYGNNS